MRKIISSVTGAAVGLAMLASAIPALATTWVSLNSGDLVKLPDDGNSATTLDTAVYYYAADGARYVFPNSKTYFTWYSNFNGVKEVSMEQLGTITIGGNVTYRPGVKMIKIESAPDAYVVDQNGTRRHITSEAVAVSIYGSNWNRMIDDVPDAFISHYQEGQPIMDAQEYQAAAATSANPTISVDKNLRAPVEVSVSTNGSFTPSSVTVSANNTIRFTNNTGSTMRVKSNLSGFDSAYIPAGLNYTYRFKNSGNWEFYNYNDNTKRGTVTVQ